MKCPNCKKEVEEVNIISECWQKGSVNKNGKVTRYGEIEEILATIKIEHREKDCWADLTDLVSE